MPSINFVMERISIEQVTVLFGQGCLLAIASDLVRLEFIGIVAGWNSSSLALMASCSLSFTSSIKPETLRVAALQSFFPNSIFFGVFSHRKGFGANGCQYRTGSVQKRGACVLYIYLPNGSCFRKGSLGGFCQLLFTFVSQPRLGSRLREISTSLTHTPPLCRKPSIVSLLGYFLGLLDLTNKFYSAAKSQRIP